MAYKVKVTGQGDTVLYIDVGDHITILPIPKNPLKVLEGLRIEEKGSVYEMRREALITAKKLVEEKLGR